MSMDIEIADPRMTVRRIGEFVGLVVTDGDEPVLTLRLTDSMASELAGQLTDIVTLAGHP